MDPVQNWVIIFIMNQKTGYLPWNCTIVLGSTILRPFKVTFSQIVTFWTPGAIATLYYLVASVVFIRKVTHFMPEHSWQAKVTKKIATWKVAVAKPSRKKDNSSKTDCISHQKFGSQKNHCQDEREMILSSRYFFFSRVNIKVVLQKNNVESISQLPNSGHDTRRLAKERRSARFCKAKAASFHKVKYLKKMPKSAHILKMCSLLKTCWLCRYLSTHALMEIQLIVTLWWGKKIFRFSRP